ncbi:hypothetical protein OAT67_00130 [Bacteriovoracaceae bacterium]|nr:hypothetical protein [Bacteriovoracaceae bacterium]
MKTLILCTIFILTNNLFAAETCSRVAVINYQDVLVDTDSSQKGEGLRYHLEKDAIAKSYLDTYQEGSRIQWPNAILGTVGTGMVITSFLTASTNNNRKTFLIGGLTMIAINFLMARTLERTNEQNLLTAIDEYNKRNLPKIFFSASGEDENSDKSDYGVSVNKEWSF